MAVALLGAVACGGAAPPPAAGGGGETIVLRVLVVENPRHPSVEPILGAALAAAETFCARDIGLPVRFEVIGRADVDSIFADVRAADTDLFRGFDERALAPFAAAGPAATRTRTMLVAAYDEDIAARGMDAVRAELRGEVPDARLEAAASPAALAALLADLHLDTARAVLGPHADDRERLAWEIWARFLGGLVGAHVVVTNQPFASFAPRVDGARTALVGGVRSGGAVQHPDPRGPGLAAAVSTFAAWSDAPPVRTGRGEADPATLVGALLAHETAHVLRRWGHAEGHEACLMNVDPHFRYGAWLRALTDSGPCELPHGGG